MIGPVLRIGGERTDLGSIKQPFIIKIEADLYAGGGVGGGAVVSAYEQAEKADGELLMRIDSDNDRIIIKEIVFGSYSAFFAIYGDYRTYVELTGTINEK